jgi:hypothetical protein
MRFSTDDNQFGLLISPTSTWGMFRFQVLLAGHLIGDEESSFIHSAMGELKNLPDFSEEIALKLEGEPARVVSVLYANEYLHDPSATLQAESLDSWMIYRYKTGDRVVFLAQEAGVHPKDASIVEVIVDLHEYQDLVNIATSYWSRINEETFRLQT